MLDKNKNYIRGEEIMRRFIFALGTIVLTSIVGCGTMKSSPSVAVIPADDKAVRSLVVQYESAVNTGDINDLLGLYAGNAVQVAPNEPSINGAQAIRMRAEGNHEFYAYSLHSDISEIQMSGHMATIRADFSETMTSKTDASDKTTTTGTWVLLLQKQSAGGWKIATEIWNDDKSIVK